MGEKIHLFTIQFERIVFDITYAIGCLLLAMFLIKKFYTWLFGPEVEYDDEEEEENEIEIKTEGK